jgi:pantoate--beta-alanine ligase
VTLQLVRTIGELHALHDAARARSGRVGLVPTMGYLHEGHASLIRAARRDCDLVTTTLFVNPLQFGPGEDLASYPRDLDGDRTLAEAAGADVLFAPDASEMYPEGAVLATVHVAELTDVLEGARRPGHFDGVATVVTKLFSIAGPCRAYFGEKDYQQLLVIQRFARDLSLRVEVVGCPTVREPDGLALSSRNVYLDGAERRAAPVLKAALDAGVAAVEAGERDTATVERRMAEVVAGEPRATLDYAAAVDAASLRSSPSLEGEIRLLIAARVGPARLIDNVAAHADPAK